MIIELMERDRKAARYSASVARRRARKERWKDIMANRLLITSVVIFLWAVSLVLLLGVGV